MPKPKPKIARTHLTKEVSVMAWIEDEDQKVLLVRQALGLRLWTLPGGKVKRGESLVKALKRELYEETGLHAQIGSLLGVLDRRDKDAITLLFAPAQKKHQSRSIRTSGQKAACRFITSGRKPSLHVVRRAQILFRL